MPLSKKQVDAARGYAEKARHGDTKALQFFADQQQLAADGNVNAQEYIAIREGKGPQGKAGKKALLDCSITHLGPKQVEAAVGLALTIDDGNENGKTFYATQKQMASQGSVIASEFVQVIEEVMDKKRRGVDIYQRPGGAAPAQSPAEKMAAALNRGKVPASTPVAVHDPKSLLGLKDRRAALQAALARCEADIEEVEGTASGESAAPEAETKKDVVTSVSTPA